jgi:hypothetical protein
MRPSSTPCALCILWLCIGTGGVSAQDAERPAPGSLDLSPQAAARALPALPEASSGRTSREPSERDLSEGIAGLVRVDDATVGQKAAYQFNRAVWRILHFWKRPPESARVRYFYIGRTVDVAVYHDGSHEVRDKRGLMLSVVAARSNKQPSIGPTSQVNDDYLSNSESAPAQAFGVGLSVREPDRALQRMVTSKEPPNSEVRDFLAATRPLRERLLADAATRAQAAASARMSEVLRTIWMVPGSSERKRQETFVLWDECSDDETGALARRQIETFVHALAERRGECPYAAADLARLNQQRQSKAPFSPCHAADLGGGSPAATQAEASMPRAQVASDAGADGL